jgi:hypothetical protein
MGVDPLTALLPVPGDILDECRMVSPMPAAASSGRTPRPVVEPRAGRPPT